MEETGTTGDSKGQQKQRQSQEAGLHPHRWASGASERWRGQYGRKKKWKGRRRDSRNVSLPFPMDSEVDKAFYDTSLFSLTVAQMLSRTELVDNNRGRRQLGH